MTIGVSSPASSDVTVRSRPSSEAPPGSPQFPATIEGPCQSNSHLSRQPQSASFASSISAPLKSRSTVTAGAAATSATRATCAGWSTGRDLWPARTGAADAGGESDDRSRDALKRRRRHRPRLHYRLSQHHSRETAEDASYWSAHIGWRTRSSRSTQFSLFSGYITEIRRR